MEETLLKKMGISKKRLRLAIESELLGLLLQAESVVMQEIERGGQKVPVFRNASGQFASKGSSISGTDSSAEEEQREAQKQKLLKNPQEEISKIGKDLASDPNITKGIIKEVGLDLPEDQIKEAMVDTTAQMANLIQAEGGETETSVLEKVVSGAMKILGAIGEDIRQGTGPHGVIAKVVGKAAAAVGITTAVLLVVGGGVTDLAFLGVNLARVLKAKGTVEQGATLAGTIGKAVSTAFSKSINATRIKNKTAQNFIAQNTFKHFQIRLISTAVLEAMTPGPALAERANFNNSYLKQAIDEISGKKNATEIMEERAELSRQKQAYIEEITGKHSLVYAHSLEHIINAIQNAQSVAELERIVDVLITQEEENAKPDQEELQRLIRKEIKITRQNT